MNFFRTHEGISDTAVAGTANSGPLSRQMAQCFSLDELRTTCRELGVDYEELAGETKTPKMASLIEAMQWQNRLAALLELLSRERPHINWQTPIVPTSRDMRNRQNILRNIQTTWIDDFLHHAISSSMTLDLNLIYQPTAVARNRPHLPRRDEMPVDRSLREVFEDYGRSLLILGDPGSGKTITMLQLAESLIVEAQQDPGQSVPVILNLSSWRQSEETFVDWLVEELFVLYGASRKLSRQWIEENQWLYLLDGLDEVAESARDTCIQAINEFRAEHPAEIVVCSRIKDYEQLSRQLNLSTAVRIQPLNDEQIRTFLDHDNGSLSAVNNALVADPELDKQAHTPLFLNIMAMALQGKSQTSLLSSTNPANQNAHLFAAYVSEMFARRPLPENGRFTRAQALQWLANLARGMKNQDQSIFYVERLQATWLPGASSMAYLISVGLVLGALVGVLNGINYIINPSFQNALIQNALMATAVFGAAGAVSVALGAIIGTRLKPVWLGVITSGVISWLLFCLIVVMAASGAQSVGLATDNTLLEWFVLSLFRGWNAFLFAMLIVYKPNIELIERLKFSRPKRAKIRQALPRGVLGGMLIGFIIGFILGMSAALIYNLTARPDIGTGQGLFIGLIWGVCATFIFTFFGAFLGACLAVANSFLRRVRIEQKLRPNQGINNSLRSALIVFIFALVPLSLFMGFGLLLMGRVGVARVVIIASWILPAVLLYFGGLAFIQHYCLRFLLVINHILPVRIVGFLDEMDDRILLRRVGGGWVFIHRALLDYFAAEANVKD